MSYPLGPIGNFLYLVSFVSSAALGVMAKPAIASILIGAVISMLGYVLVRLPQMIRIYHESENGRILLLPLYMLIGHSIIPAIVYGIARLFS